MTIHIDEESGEDTLIGLENIEDWAHFTNENQDALIEQYGSCEAAYRHLRDGGLVLGGGASPTVHVYFTDEFSE